MQIKTVRGYTASNLTHMLRMCSWLFAGFQITHKALAVSGEIWWFSNLVSSPLAIRMMQQRERQIWAGKRVIFRPLRWDLWTNNRQTGKQVIQALADGDLKQSRSFLGNILAFAVWWFNSEPARLMLFLVGHTTSPNVLKILQNGLKHRETTKNTTGKQGNLLLFTKHWILGI